MSIVWIKLTGRAADMLSKHKDVEPTDFPPALFIEYLLDARALSIEKGDTNAEQKPFKP